MKRFALTPYMFTITYIKLVINLTNGELYYIMSERQFHCHLPHYYVSRGYFH